MHGVLIEYGGIHREQQGGLPQLARLFHQLAERPTSRLYTYATNKVSYAKDCDLFTGFGAHGVRQSSCGGDYDYGVKSTIINDRGTCTILWRRSPVGIAQAQYGKINIDSSSVRLGPPKLPCLPHSEMLVQAPRSGRCRVVSLRSR